MQQATKSATIWQKQELPDGWKRRAPAGFESLDDAKINQEAIDELRRLVRERLFPIFVHGATGRGKSFLAVRAFVGFQSRDGATFLRYGDFVEETIRASKNGQIGSFPAIRDTGLVVLDEIGSGIANEWKNEILLKLLDVRRDRPLIITSNVKPSELAQVFDARIASRILAGSLLELGGDDLRREWINDPAERARRVVKIV